MTHIPYPNKRPAARRYVFISVGKKGSRKATTIVVIESRIAAKDTLFPEKVVKANKILSNTKFLDSVEGR